MREIKFRIWNKEIEEMYEVTKLEYLGSTGIVDQYIGHDSAIWMQYTGLKDKNGVEIYEGDIIEYIHGCRFKVVFNDWSFGWIEGDFIPFANMAKSEFSNFKVIGNIYENKELLEGK